MKTIIFCFTAIFSFAIIENIHPAHVLSVLPAKCEDTIKRFDKLLKLKWEMKLSHPQHGLPNFVNGLAFLPEERDYAVDIEKGEKLYFKSPKHQIIIRKRCADSLVYIYNKSQSELIDIYSGKQKVFYNKPFVWSYDIRELFVTNSMLIQIVDENMLECYFLEDMWSRKNIWNKQIGRIRGNIITKDSLAFVSDFDYFYILDKRTGKELWKAVAKDGIYSSQYIVDNLLYVITYIDNKRKELWCVDIKKLDFRWKYEFPSFAVKNSLYIDKTNIYFIGDAGIYCVDRINGIYKSLYKGNYLPWYISAIKDYLIVYDREIEANSYNLPVVTGVDKKTGRTTFQYFTSEGFPYEPPIYTKEELEEYRKDGSLSEIREISDFDYGMFTFKEVPNSNIVLTVFGTYFYAFEVIEK